MDFIICDDMIRCSLIAKYLLIQVQWMEFVFLDIQKGCNNNMKGWLFVSNLHCTCITCEILQLDADL